VSPLIDEGPILRLAMVYLGDRIGDAADPPLCVPAHRLRCSHGAITTHALERQRGPSFCAVPVPHDVTVCLLIWLHPKSL